MKMKTILVLCTVFVLVFGDSSKEVESSVESEEDQKDELESSANIIALIDYLRHSIDMVSHKLQHMRNSVRDYAKKVPEAVENNEEIHKIGDIIKNATASKETKEKCQKVLDQQVKALGDEFRVLFPQIAFATIKDELIQLQDMRQNLDLVEQNLLEKLESEMESMREYKSILSIVGYKTSLSKELETVNELKKNPNLILDYALNYVLDKGYIRVKSETQVLPAVQKCLNV